MEKEKNKQNELINENKQLKNAINNLKKSEQELKENLIQKTENENQLLKKLNELNEYIQKLETDKNNKKVKMKNPVNFLCIHANISNIFSSFFLLGEVLLSHSNEHRSY